MSSCPRHDLLCQCTQIIATVSRGQINKKKFEKKRDFESEIKIERSREEEKTNFMN